MKRKKYIYTNKKHPEKAILSTILGCISLLSMLFVIYLTYLADGQTQGGYGLTGLFSLGYALAGFLLGATSFQERETFLLFPILGTVINLLVLIGVGFIFYLGVN